MDKVKCRIKTYKQPSAPENGNIYMSAGMAETLGISENTQIILNCGARGIPANVRHISESESKEGPVLLSSNITESLLLPNDVTAELTRNGQSIRIGPVIGVLTEHKLLLQYMKGRVTREEFNHYFDAGEKSNCIVYIFDLYGLNTSNKSITGYIRQTDGEGGTIWQRRDMPVPDAIHNRIVFSAISPVNQDIEAVRQLNPGISIINRITSIDKLSVARILEKEAGLRQYLPETRHFKGPDTIAELLSVYGSVFLKPVSRSLGLGVIKVTKAADSSFEINYRHKNENFIKQGSLETLLANLSEVMGNRTYLVQQGIPLAKYQDRPFDLRVTVQKDNTGEWSVSSWGTRVAAPGNIVTNVAAGGTGTPIMKVLTAVFADKTEEILLTVNKAALCICKAMDRNIRGLGDLGLDIGLDLTGRPYLIEVNFRDYRLTDIEMEDIDSWAMTYYKPIYYLKHLYDRKYKQNNPVV